MIINQVQNNLSTIIKCGGEIWDQLDDNDDIRIINNLFSIQQHNERQTVSNMYDDNEIYFLSSSTKNNK